MTLCKDCQHFSEEKMYSDFSGWSVRQWCAALKGRENPITGVDIEAIDAHMMRASLCGWSDPRLFEAKE